MSESTTPVPVSNETPHEWTRLQQQYGTLTWSQLRSVSAGDDICLTCPFTGEECHSWGHVLNCIYLVDECQERLLVYDPDHREYFWWIVAAEFSMNELFARDEVVLYTRDTPENVEWYRINLPHEKHVFYLDHVEGRCRLQYARAAELQALTPNRDYVHLMNCAQPPVLK